MKVFKKVFVLVFILFLSGCKTTKIVYTVNGSCVIGTVVED